MKNVDAILCIVESYFCEEVVALLFVDAVTTWVMVRVAAVSGWCGSLHCRSQADTFPARLPRLSPPGPHSGPLHTPHSLTSDTLTNQHSIPQYRDPSVSKN